LCASGAKKTNTGSHMTDSTYIGNAFIISPLLDDGQPAELYFVVTEGGYLLHMEKMDKDITNEYVASELSKLLIGLEKQDGRYNEFIKNREHYKVRMAIVPPLSIQDARVIDSMYRMNKDKRIEEISKNMERWAR